MNITVLLCTVTKRCYKPRDLRLENKHQADSNFRERQSHY